jgi:hypothetical protein
MNFLKPLVWPVFEKAFYSGDTGLGARLDFMTKS